MQAKLALGNCSSHACRAPASQIVDFISLLNLHSLKISPFHLLIVSRPRSRSRPRPSSPSRSRPAGLSSPRRRPPQFSALAATLCSARHPLGRRPGRAFAVSLTTTAQPGKNAMVTKEFLDSDRVNFLIWRCAPPKHPGTLDFFCVFGTGAPAPLICRHFHHHFPPPLALHLPQPPFPASSPVSRPWC